MKQYITPDMEIVTLVSRQRMAYEFNMSDTWGAELDETESDIL